ncbi:MAG: ABC transporter ATP-binding protein [Anaerolineae bacterium]
MPEYAIEVRDLTRDFATVRAVDAISFAVPSGTVFGFLGPNGSGKTTTIRLLLGLLEPTSGGATVLGHDVRGEGQAIRERCGALLEHTGLYERLSAADNLEFYGRVWRLPRGERQARSKALLEHFGLWERRRENAGTWSRGMKQKLAIARALLHRPALVFFDEPTAGLDPVAAASLRDDLAALAAREGTTVFLTTHNLSEAERLCTQVAVIRQGRLLAVGSPDALRRQTGRPHIEVVGRGFTPAIVAAIGARPEVATATTANGRLTIDLAADIDTAVLVSDLVRAGAQVEEVRRGQASLEDVFLSLVEEENQ